MEKSTNKISFDVQGHRGCRGYMPENSIQGFIRAIDLGVTILEMDVVISKDKQVVVSHEPWISNHICKLPEVLSPDSIPYKYNIYQMPYAEIKQYDCGSKVHPDFPNQNKLATNKPLLFQVIQAVERYTENKNLKPVGYNIEMKYKPEGVGVFHPDAEEFARLLVEVLQTESVLDRSCIQSFDLDCLKEVNRRQPDMEIALLVNKNEDYTRKMAELGFQPDILSPDNDLVDDELIAFCHNKSIKVVPWTVNDPVEINRLIELGVDGLISDYPDRIHIILNQLTH